MKSMYKPEFWQNLLLICEIISNGYFPVSLDFLSIFVVFCGIVVIISKNPPQEIWEISILFYPPPSASFFKTGFETNKFVKTRGGGNQI